MINTIEQYSGLLFDAEAHVASFWKFYITVSLAVIGYVFSAKAPLEYRNVRRGVSAVFLVFALSNCMAIYGAQEKLVAMHEICIENAKENSQIGADHPIVTDFLATPPRPVLLVTAFHLLVDACVILIVLKVPQIRKALVVTKQVASGSTTDEAS